MRAAAHDLREMLLEQWHYRDLLYEMTRRDLLIRYKQTIMGFGWAVFMPLVNTAVFSVIFTRVAAVSTPVPYPVFAYCGLLFWNFSASTFRASVGSLTSNAGLVTKVYFPREIFPFSAMIVALVDLAVGSSVLVALMAWYDIAPSGYIVLLPVVVVAHVMLTAAISLLVAMGNLLFRDVKYLFEVFVTLWMFATPVLYPLDAIDGRAGMMLKLNPMAPIIDGYRTTMLGSASPDLSGLAATLSLSFLALIGVWLLFHRSEFQFAERI